MQLAQMIECKSSTAQMQVCATGKAFSDRWLAPAKVKKCLAPLKPTYSGVMVKGVRVWRVKGVDQHDNLPLPSEIWRYLLCIQVFNNDLSHL